MKLPHNEIKSIAVFRALQLGDMLCAIPAIRALRQHCPHAHITLLGLPWAAFLVERFPHYFDAFMHFPGYPGLPEQEVDPKAFLSFLAAVQEKKFDLVLQMQGNGTIVNPMVALFGAKYTAGFRLPDIYAPDDALFLEYPTGIHEIERHLQLMQHLGIPADDTQLEFPLYEQDAIALREHHFPLQPGQYVCVHPGSRGVFRRWPPALFAQLADYCAQHGYQIVLTGTKDEMDIVHEVAQHMKAQPVIAAGKTSIGAVSVLIKEAAALISNCTGVSHIAAALKTPSVVISLDGEPERWGPLNKELHYTIDWTKTPDFSLVFDQLKRLMHQVSQRNHFGNEQVGFLKEYTTGSH